MLQHGSSFTKTLRQSFLLTSRFSSTEGYNGQRAQYKGQLSEMRKVWLDDFTRRNELKQQQIKEERIRVVQEKAVRLREKRKASMLRQEVDRKAKAEALRRFRENLARKHLQWDKKAEKQQGRYKQLAADLTRESATWITKENMDSRITADLFAQEAATTGLVTRYSKHWRYNAVSVDYEIAQLMNPASFVQQENTLLGRFQQAKAEGAFHRRQDIEAFLEPMISTGAERAQLADLVKEYSAAMNILEKPDQFDDLVALEHENDRDDLHTGQGFWQNQIEYDKNGDPIDHGSDDSEGEDDPDMQMLDGDDSDSQGELSDEFEEDGYVSTDFEDSDAEAEGDETDAKLARLGRELKEAQVFEDFDDSAGDDLMEEHASETYLFREDVAVRLGLKELTKDMTAEQLADFLDGQGADEEVDKKPEGWEQAADFFDADEKKK